MPISGVVSFFLRAYICCTYQVIGNTASSQSTVNLISPGSSSELMPKYNYLVKIISPKKKSEFEVQSLKSKQMFLSLADLKQQILLDHKEKVPNPLSVIGYIQPGHGLSGKKKWLTSDSDLDDMYGTCTVKHDIMLWCHGSTTCPQPVRGSKRSQSVRADNAPRKTSRYDTHVDRMAEVQEI